MTSQTNTIRAAIIASTNNPIADDSCECTITIPNTVITDAEIINFVNKPNSAIFLYEGPDYEGKIIEVLHDGFRCSFPSKHLEQRGIKTLEDIESQGLTTIRETLFSPLESSRQLQSAAESTNDDCMDDWHREIAIEEGMLQGVNSYNDYMGYSLGHPNENW